MGHLHRDLTRLKRERTQHANLIQSLLFLLGLRLAVRSSFLEDLAQLSIPSRLRARLIRQYQRRQLVEDQIRDVEKERRDLIASGETVTARQAAHLSKICGIGEIRAWVFCQRAVQLAGVTKSSPGRQLVGARADALQQRPGGSAAGHQQGRTTRRTGLGCRDQLVLVTLPPPESSQSFVPATIRLWPAFSQSGYRRVGAQTDDRSVKLDGVRNRAGGSDLEGVN